MESFRDGRIYNMIPTNCENAEINFYSYFPLPNSSVPINSVKTGIHNASRPHLLSSVVITYIVTIALPYLNMPAARCHKSFLNDEPALRVRLVRKYTDGAIFQT